MAQHVAVTLTGEMFLGADFIEQVADNIDALGDELVERVQLETGIVEAMQYLVPGWTFDPKRPALRREGTTP
jgi:hypothetical protein